MTNVRTAVRRMDSSSNVSFPVNGANGAGDSFHTDPVEDLAGFQGDGTTENANAGANNQMPIAVLADVVFAEIGAE